MPKIDKTSDGGKRGFFARLFGAPAARKPSTPMRKSETKKTEVTKSTEQEELPEPENAYENVTLRSDEPPPPPKKTMDDRKDKRPKHGGRDRTRTAEEKTTDDDKHESGGKHDDKMDKVHKNDRLGMKYPDKYVKKH